jgi:hypothetical protein
MNRVVSNRIVAALAAALLFALPAAADTPLRDRGTVLDRLAGQWVLTGTIAGQPTTHDVDAGWVLQGHYLRLHELARETDPATGAAAYEAIVLVGWDEPTGRFACLWLDVTGGSGLCDEGIGHAGPGDEALAFVWDDGNGRRIHNTWTHHPETDTWSWAIDDEQGGERSAFARVVLRRR